MGQVLIEKGDLVELALYRVESVKNHEDTEKLRKFLHKLEKLTMKDHLKDEKYTVKSDWQFKVKSTSVINNELHIGIYLNKEILTIPARVCSYVWQKRFNDEGKPYEWEMFISLLNANTFINNNWIDYKKSANATTLKVVEPNGELINKNSKIKTT